MIPFLTNKQAAEKIADLEQRLEVMQRDNDAAQTQISDLQAETANLSEQVANLTEANVSLTAQAESLVAERDQSAEALAAANIQLESFDERVESAALARFESLGGQPVPDASNEETLTEEQIRAKFSEMKAGPERTAFFKKHKSTLSIRK